MFSWITYFNSIPNAWTIWLVRERIQKACGVELLFDVVQHQLQRNILTKKRTKLHHVYKIRVSVDRQHMETVLDLANILS